MRLTETGIWLQMVWGLCSYCLYMGTFKLGVVIVFAAGQWDIRSCFRNGRRHFGIMDCIALIDLTTAYDLPFILSFANMFFFHSVGLAAT